MMQVTSTELSLFRMNALRAELNRLYLPASPPDAPHDDPEPHLIDPEGRVRAMVLELARPAEWAVLSTVWQKVQTELGLPAPAIAVSGVDGFQLWFSLAEPILATQAWAFLESVRLRYLKALAPQRIGLMPAVSSSKTEIMQHARLVPALQPASGRWSAFVAPDLAAIFSDDPWLDVCPSAEAQASVLSRLECTQPAALQAAMHQMTPGANSNALPPPKGPEMDPKGFLLRVMNDVSVDLGHRIAAAKALLPHF